MDGYFEELQRKIEAIEEKQDLILSKLEKSEQPEDSPLKANECNQIWKVSRATGNKIRKHGIANGLLNPITRPTGSVVFLKSEVIALNHKSHL